MARAAMQDHSMARLLRETSPLLLRHANDRVQWWPWGSEARDEARRLRRPMLVLVADFACSACASLPLDVLSDAELAAQLNRDFVCVLVDRLRWPDVDRQCRAAIEALYGRAAGWPCMVFMRPSGEPFAGLLAAAGPGAAARWRDAAAAASRLDQDAQALRAQASRVAAALDAVTAAGASPPRQGAGPTLARLVEAAGASFDEAWGGFGRPPRHPPLGIVLALLAQHRRSADEEALHMAAVTMEELSRGGLHDLTSGCIGALALDRQWHTPHFDQHLADNALFVRTLAELAVGTGASGWRELAARAARSLMAQFELPDGGFAAAIAARPAAGPVTPQAWNIEEATEALRGCSAWPPERLGIRAAGRWRPGLSLPRLPDDAPVATWADPDLHAALDALAAARASRPRTARDDTLLVADNALAIAGLVAAAAACATPAALDAAVRAAQRLVTELWEIRDVGGQRRLLRCLKDGRAEVPALADDYALLALALLDVGVATGEERWRDEAERLTDELLALFGAPGAHLLTRVGRDQSGAATTAVLHGDDRPDTNEAAALLLARLGAGRRPDLGDRADAILAARAPYASLAPLRLPWGAIAAGLRSPTAAAIAKSPDSRPPRDRAPLLPTAEEYWLNLGAQAPPQLDGRVTVLHFWTHGCANCLHVLPELELLKARCSDPALQIVSVHCGKFDREQERDSVRAAIGRLAASHPVLLDERRGLWRSLAVRGWPTVIVVGADRRVRWRRAGEVEARGLQRVVQRALQAASSAWSPHVQNAPTRSLPGQAAATAPWPTKVVVASLAGEQSVFVSDAARHSVTWFRLQRRDGGWGLHERCRWGDGHPGLVDGGNIDARLNAPEGMALWRGALLVADRGNHALRRIDLDTLKVNTLAGDGALADATMPTGLGAPQRLRSPWDLAVAGDTVLVAMAGCHQLWSLDAATGALWPLAGTGTEGRVDGAFSRAALAQPTAVAAGPDAAYFLDSESSSLRVADLQRREIRTLVAGELFNSGDRAGALDDSKLQHPTGLGYRDGRLLVADTYNHKVRLVDLKRRIVRDVAGPPDLREPSDAAFLGKDHAIIADAGNGRLVVVALRTGKIDALAELA